MKSMIMFAIMAFGLYANEFTQAVENYNKGEYEKAFDTFYLLAKEGNAKAQYNLGKLYHSIGHNDAHAYEKAKYWYEKAVKGGIIQAYNNFAALYIDGFGVERNEQKALTLLEEAASKEDASAQVNLAVLYAWGEEVTHDKMKAYENFKAALKSGKSEASGYLDKLCQESAWVCQD